MERVQLHMNMLEAITKWDPFQLGEEAYETEATDVIQAYYDTKNKDELSKRIQGIYEWSFERIIPLDQCKELVDTLYKLEDETDSCSL